MVSATKDDIVVSLHNRSAKEDNGQMFRIALTLSAMTGTPVRIENIFAARNNKGETLPAVHNAPALPC